MKLICSLFDFRIRFLKRSSDQKSIQYRYQESVYTLSLKYFSYATFALKFLVTPATNK